MKTVTICLYITNNLNLKMFQNINYVSEIFMGLQPCGSDMIRQSGAGGNAMI